MQVTRRLLSVLVVAFNERPHLARLKASLDRLERPPGTDIETILIDGGSVDGTVPHANELGFSPIMEMPGANIPACRNAGLEAARGEWLAFIDADCELAPDWFRCAYPLLERIRPAIMGWPAAPPQPGSWVQRAWHAHWLHKNFHRESVAGRSVIRREAFRLLQTRNMLLHREAAEQVGGFDEALATGEDTDFVFRAYLEGVTVLGVPEMRATHYGEPATLGAFFRQQRWHANRKSYKRIMEKTGGRLGANAPIFSALFLITSITALAGLGGAALGHNRWLILALPWFGLHLAPAAWIAFRARSPRLLPALGVLYAAYGLARGLNLVGLYQAKPSWKRPVRSAATSS